MNRCHEHGQYGHGMTLGTLLFVMMLAFWPAAMRTLRPRATWRPATPAEHK